MNAQHSARNTDKGAIIMQEPIKFEDHTGLVGYFTQKYYEKAQPRGFWQMDDIYQEGAIGLIKAIRTFKPEKGFSFSTYAGTCIRNQILMFFRKENKHICLPILSCPVIDQEEGSEMITLYDMIPHRESTEDEYMAVALREFLVDYKDNIKRRNKDVEAREKIIVQMILDGKRQTEMKQVIGLSQSITSRYVTKVKRHVANEWGKDTSRLYSKV